MLPKLTVPIIIPELVIQGLSETYNWGMRDLNIPEIHRQVMGDGIKVAIVDSGKPTHFEVENNTIGAKNFSDSNTLKDKTGHSSFVAGIVAAEKNDEGIIGVAPKAKLLFAKALGDDNTASPSALVNAVKWATKQKVDIISISAGFFFDFKPLHMAIKEAHQKNIIVVAAVGNSASRHYDVAFPARYPEVIGVAAYDKNRKIAKFSSRGINIFCAMPGVKIYSCWLNNQFVRSSGSSFAAPYLSGICALILAKHRKQQSNTPCKTPKQMVEHLTKYSVKLGNTKDAGKGTIDLSGLLNQGI